MTGAVIPGDEFDLACFIFLSGDDVLHISHFDGACHTYMARLMENMGGRRAYKEDILEISIFSP